MIDQIWTTRHLFTSYKKPNIVTLPLIIFPPTQLHELFLELEIAAKQQHYALLPKIDTDLFQLEISCLHDGPNVVLLLHAQM